METYEICHEIVKTIGRRRFARAVGRDESTVYAWAREPMSVQSPDGTGKNNVFDWLEALVETMASIPGAKKALLVIEQWFRALFDRVLRRIDGDPLACTDERILQAARVAAEHGQAMEKFLTMDDDVESLRHALDEALETRHEWDRIIEGITQRLENVDPA